MRAPLLGVVSTGLDQLEALVRASTRMTHTDPRAFQGALAVALAARMARQGGTPPVPDYLDELAALFREEGKELLDLIRRAAGSAAGGATTEQFASELGRSRGVSGYVCHTVPVVLHAWFAHPLDFRSAVESVVRCGGDTDTTAAIVGGIVGAGVGREGLPADWLAAIMEWPRTVGWMERLAARLFAVVQSGHAERPPSLPVVPMFLRNMSFLGIVLLHGFRRLLPPY